MADRVEIETRTLAERLAAAGDHELARALASRRISPQVPWRDFFDAAQALLDPGSVAAAVQALPRDALCELADASGGERLSLSRPDGRPYRRVAEALPSGLSPTPPTTPPAASADAAARAAEHAFTGLSSMADVLLDALRSPLARVSGGLGAGDRRRLVQDGVAQSSEDAETIVHVAEVTGLLRGEERRWLVTAEGDAWVRGSTAERWTHLASRLRAALPEGLRAPGIGADAPGWVDPAAWPDAYPLSASWPNDAARWTAAFRLAGLIADDGEPAWATPLREGRAPAPEPLLALLPSEVDKVFLQNDLTAIAPGPLAPELDVRLRAMAMRESHAQASSYRFTEATIASALSVGETAESIRDFLTTLSLTGLPQPLAYLVERTSDRHGLVRVSVEPDTGHTIVSSRDHQLLETISVDQALRALGLIPDGRLLRTRADRGAVYWALSDARYPVVAIDDEGVELRLNRRRIAPEPEPSSDRYAALIRRLRDAQSDDTDAAWLERELDAAVREKTPLIVEVSMPDGSTREFALDATGLGGGRLRGLDRAADVERTLPLRSIASVRRASASPAEQ